MKEKIIKAQLNNWQSTLKFQRELKILAKNVFLYDNMPELIDMSYVRNRMITAGSVAFFYDEALGVLALPYNIIGNLDLYGNPLRIQVYSKSNGFTRTLEYGEFIIMYDNTEKVSMMPLLLQYAFRLALIERTIDINIAQQKTPRIWKSPQEKIQSLQRLVNNIDGNVEQIIAYDDLTAKDIDIIINPAPYVTDKLQLEKEKIYNEFLRVIGVASLNVQKKERVITDEVEDSRGGSIVMRYNRFEPREKAIDKINKKWGLNIKLKYYDEQPSSFEKFEKIEDEEEELEDDTF